jgi:hypothetical protein
MTITGIAARPERNSQGLWISVSCGVSVTACSFIGSFDEDAVLEDKTWSPLPIECDLAAALGQ